MELKAAIERAGSDDRIKKLHGCYLGSCFACIKDAGDRIDEWTLLYYNPEKELATDCFVNDKFVTIGTETRPLKNIEKMDIGGVHVDVHRALSAANERFGRKTISILITLHSRTQTMWTINMISADMNATTYDIDAKTGSIIREETTSLIRKL